MKKKCYLLAGLILILGLVILLIAISDEKDYHQISRYEKIPSDIIKVSPETDLNPLKSLSLEYQDPIPLPYPINTAGAEDSPFIMPDGNTLYFWFTPDVRVPVEKQIIDGVTGIYRSKKINNVWQEPERIWLQNPGKLALDGCAYVDNQEKNIWFCSAREGHVGISWFTAEFDDSLNKWKNWELIKFPIEYEVGELHIYENEIYYHSNRLGGKGGMDIWIMGINADGTFSNPRNLVDINTERDEGFPALSPDGKELWFSKDYATWRSKKVGDKWAEPEKMFSPLAGEPSVDNYGNVYFTHHFFEGDRMIEADIYVAYKR